MTVPATAIYFTAYDQLKTFLCGRALTSDLYAPMVAGALARCEHSPGALDLSLNPSSAGARCGLPALVSGSLGVEGSLGPLDPGRGGVYRAL